MPLRTFVTVVTAWVVAVLVASGPVQTPALPHVRVPLLSMSQARPPGTGPVPLVVPATRRMEWRAIRWQK